MARKARMYRNPFMRKKANVWRYPYWGATKVERPQSSRRAAQPKTTPELDNYIELYSRERRGPRWVRGEDGVWCAVSSGVPDYDKVAPRLYVGNFEACSVFDGFCINVTERPCVNDHCTHMRIMGVSKESWASKDVLTQITGLVSALLLNTDKNVLLHCYVGMERSALAATWFLHQTEGLSLQDAFAKVKAGRDIAADRLFWLERDSAPTVQQMLLSDWSTEE